MNRVLPVPDDDELAHDSVGDPNTSILKVAVPDMFVNSRIFLSPL
jgi:hypothetical protein